MMAMHLIWLFAVGALVYWVARSGRYGTRAPRRWHEIGELGANQLPSAEREADQERCTADRSSGASDENEP